MKRNFRHAFFITILIAAAAMLGSARPLSGAQIPQKTYNKQSGNNEVPVAQPDDAVVNNSTNGITARIQSDLDSVKNKINAAVKSLQEAVASNQAQRALSVSNVA